MMKDRVTRTAVHVMTNADLVMTTVKHHRLVESTTAVVQASAEMEISTHLVYIGETLPTPARKGCNRGRG